MSVSSKITVLALFVICSITFIQGNFVKSIVDEGIYTLIDAFVNDKYKDNPKKAECMSKDFRQNQVANKFYTTNPEKLSRELQPFIDEADLSK